MSTKRIEIFDSFYRANQPIITFKVSGDFKILDITGCTQYNVREVTYYNVTLPVAPEPIKVKDPG
jgi:hypothetical protein